LSKRFAAIAGACHVRNVVRVRAQHGMGLKITPFPLSARS
jgi:hypothetical protein